MVFERRSGKRKITIYVVLGIASDCFFHWGYTKIKLKLYGKNEEKQKCSHMVAVGWKAGHPSVNIH